MKIQEYADNILRETEKIYIGKEAKLKLILMAVFSGGHILLDDLPGSGKTTLVKTLSRALGCDMKRIQFTPDLLPSDITGMTIFNKNTGGFETLKGPVFTNILLADEINRAIPRTQAALLESMEERQVTIDNQSFTLPDPFLVMATQNPVEHESTFPLPAAQMDRFFIKLSLGFPSREEEIRMLSEQGDAIDFKQVKTVTGPEELRLIRREIADITVSDHVKTYIVSLVHATRSHPSLLAGASPRASKCLFQGGKSLAAIKGRDYVTPEDIQEIFLPIVSHRVVLSQEARYTKKAEAEILTEVLASTPVPPRKEDLFHEKDRQ